MAANRLAPGSETARDAAPAPSAAGTPGADSPGGLKAWLPLIVTLAVMPALAWATTTFILLPKLRQAVSQPAAPAEAAEGADSTVGQRAPGEKRPSGGKAKYNVSLSKMIVNVAGTAGTRYLMTSVTLVGARPDFKELVEENRDQLLDLAHGTLGAKTIGDLEKPGARNQIRAELMSVFNHALGGNVVKELYLTEMAIQ